MSKRAEEIKALHEEVMEAQKSTVSKAIRIGELLAKQKSELKHGQFGKWLKENLGSAFSTATANNYMKVAAEKEKLKFLRVGNLADAYRVLYSSKKPQAVPAPTNKEQEPSEEKADDPPKFKQYSFPCPKDRIEEVDELIRSLQMEREFKATQRHVVVIKALKFTKEHYFRGKADSASRNGDGRVGGAPKGEVPGSAPLRSDEADSGRSRQRFEA